MEVSKLIKHHYPVFCFQNKAEKREVGVKHLKPVLSLGMEKKPGGAWWRGGGGPN